MQAVFLDYATMGPDLDLQPLRALFPELKVYDGTTNDEVAARISGVEDRKSTRLNSSH